MWVDAGFDPDSFWHQTPRTFQVAMRGVRKRMEREAEARYAHAYDTAWFFAHAQAGSLKKFDHYTKKPEAVTTPTRALAAITSMGGGTMKVRKIKRGEG